MEMKKWLFEANGKEEPIEEPVEEVIEDVVEEVIEEVTEEAPSHHKVGDTKDEGGHRLYWTGDTWLDYVNYRRTTGNS